jgi:hypothetical protein
LANASKSGCATPARSSTIEVDQTTLRVYDRLIKTVPAPAARMSPDHKAYGHTTNRKTG